MILVFIEHRNNALSKTSLEAVAAAQSLASQLQQTVTAVVLGSGSAGLAQEVAAHELGTVLNVDNPKLEVYTADGYTGAMEQVIRKLEPAIVVMAHTYLVRDFAPRLAARFAKSLISDCIKARINGGPLVLTRRMFLGKLEADVVSDGQAPVFITFQAGAFRADQVVRGSGAKIENFEVEIGEIRTAPEPAFQETKQAVDLSRAEVIVAIGRGIKSKENIALAERLAEVLGGDLAASRPICDAEWLPIDRQIGSSGQTVSPKLYIALGISGAIQHLVGMKNSGTIVAINKDPEAPIFDIADYGIVGDLFEAVPVLTEEIKKIKAS